MCVIIVCPTKDPDLATLYKCEDKNPHGGGVAWAANGYVHFKKGIKSEEMLDLASHQPFPHVFHFRIASVGHVIPALCHPFLVKRKHNCDMAGVSNNPLLFHNGTIPEWRFMAQLAGVKYPDFASDSMVIARIVSLRGAGILPHLINGNKFVVLWPNGEVKTYGAFAHRGGVEGIIEYSNTYWDIGRQIDYGKHSGSYAPTCGSQQEFQDEDGPGDLAMQCPECKKRNVETDEKGQFLCNDCYNLWTNVPVPTESDEHAATIQASPEYRDMTPDEIVEKGDELLCGGEWRVASASIGSHANSFQYRRRLPTPTPIPIS